MPDRQPESTDGYSPADRQLAEGGRDEVEDALRKQDERKRAPADEPGDRERAEEIAADTAKENPDPITRREAIERALEAEDLSEEGSELGQHNE